MVIILLKERFQLLDTTDRFSRLIGKCAPCVSCFEGVARGCACFTMETNTYTQTGEIWIHPEGCIRAAMRALCMMGLVN